MPAPPNPLVQERPWGVIGEGLGPQRGINTIVLKDVDSDGTSGALDIVGTNGALTLECYNRGTDSIAIDVQFSLTPVPEVTDPRWAAYVAWEHERMNPLGSGGFITPVIGPQVIPAATVQGFALLDTVPTLRFITSSANAGALLTCRLYMVPN